MKILVLGGTAFLGRTIVESALAGGHELTLFNRGQRNPELFPDVEQIHGDRLTDLSLLHGRNWDAVVDTSGYVPRAVDLSSSFLKDATDQYLFISTVSVFKDMAVAGQNEEAELATLEDPTVEEVTGETYGGLKVLCEEVIHKAFDKRALIVRPGLIVGPNDYTDRFTYWPVRMSRGGDVLVPDVKDQPVQIIDVRDISAWCVDLLERQVTGTFNATGPQNPYTLEEMLRTCAERTESNLIWVDKEFVIKNEVKPWAELPLLLDLDGSHDGMLQFDVSKASQAGLKMRPLSETVVDTRAWALSRPTDYTLKAGLDPERETELLSAWKSR